VFNRFGQLAVEVVPLEQHGLVKKWAKLDRLQQEVASLEERRQQAERDVVSLRQAIDAARAKDAEAASRAIRAGKDVPAPKHEKDAVAAVEGAERTSSYLYAAVSDAAQDLHAYTTKHRSELLSDLAQAREELAAALAALCPEIALKYRKLLEVEALAKRLGPPVAHEENHGEPEDTAVFIGPMTIRTISGPSPGDIEAALSYLASLAPTGSEKSAREASVAETTIVGGLAG
jgi:hypothetical protein